MSKARHSLSEVVYRLRDFYGWPDPPKVTDPLCMILLENVAYLVSDERRELAFNALREKVGLIPTEILTAREEILLEVASLGGMRPAARVEPNNNSHPSMSSTTIPLDLSSTSGENA